MKVPRELIDRAEEALTFDPRARRRALVERAPATDADPAAVQRRLAQVLGEGVAGSGATELAVDRIVYGGDQLNVSFLERGMTAADAVARVEVYDEESALLGHGTGFMVSPRLLLTNHHVLRSIESAASSWVDFRHEFDALGRPVEATTFSLDPAAFFFTDPALDITVVAVSPTTPDGSVPVAAFGWLRLTSSRDVALPGEWLSLVHHPGGRAKQLSLRQSLLVAMDDSDLWYVTESAGGSSGAPVFNDAWQVTAVHRLGVAERDRSGAILTLDGSPWTPATDESEIVWRANVATRSSMVVRRLWEACGTHPLVQPLFAEGNVDAAEAVVLPFGSGEATAAARPPIPASGNGTGDSPIVAPVMGLPAASGNGNGAGGQAALEEGPNESITITVPLRITLRSGETGGRQPIVGVDLS